MYNRLNCVRKAAWLVCAALVSLPAVAAPENGHARGEFKGYPGHGMDRQRGGDPAMRVLGRLGLSEEQKARVGEIVKSRASEMEDLRFDLMEGQKLLRRATTQPEADSQAVRAACDRVAAAELQVKLGEAKTWSGVLPILTDEQKEKLDGFLGRREGRRGGHRGEMADAEPREFAPGGPLGRMLSKLALTDEQKAQVKAVVETSKDSAQAALRADRQCHRDVLKEVVGPEFDQAALEKACAAHAAAHVEIALKRAEMYASLYRILTDEQKREIEHRRERMERIQRL